MATVFRQSSAHSRVAMVVVVAMVGAGSASAAILHVHAFAPPGGDGSTWGSAFNDLADALDVANPGDQVWIAEGTYRPDRGTGLRDMSFILTSGVQLFGGFAGDERTLAERDPAAHPTILSGDLEGNDDPGAVTTLAENSRHVVQAFLLLAPARLDGLTIQGGNADTFSGGGQGGGLRALLADIELVNVRFTNNRAREQGGGLWMFGGSLQVESSDILDNQAFLGSGGGIYAAACDLTFSDGDVIGNVAGKGKGGGVYVASGSATFTNCIADGNLASTTLGGGAGAFFLRGDVSMVNVHFDGNVASPVGTFDIDPGAGSVTILGCSARSLIGSPAGLITLDGGEALVEGCLFEETAGGLRIDSTTPTSFATVRLCEFRGTTGPALTFYAGEFLAEDCLFEDNDHLTDSTAAGIIADALGTIRRCDFINNHCAGGAGGISAEDGATVEDCLFQSNGSRAMKLRGEARNCTFLQNGSPLTTNGGAVHLLGSNSMVRDCAFVENASVTGGAVYLTSTSSVVGCDFVGNRAVRGAAIARNASAESGSWIISSRMVGNVVLASSNPSDGGTISVQGRLSMANLLLSGNVGQSQSAGITVLSGAFPVTIHTSTLSGNSSPGGGDGIRLQSGTLSLSNSILWGNGDGTAGDQLLVSGGSASVDWCCVQGGVGGLPGMSNIALDPLFVAALGADGILGTLDDDLHLRFGSPCVNTGNAALLPVDVVDADEDDDVKETLDVDLDGATRVVGALDRGAYESATAGQRRPLSLGIRSAAVARRRALAD